MKRSTLPLSQPHVVWMEYGVRAMHYVDAQSPLRAIADRARVEGRLGRAFHILATITGTHAVTGQTVTRYARSRPAPVLRGWAASEHTRGCCSRAHRQRHWHGPPLHALMKAPSTRDRSTPPPAPTRALTVPPRPARSRRNDCVRVQRVRVPS